MAEVINDPSPPTPATTPTTVDKPTAVPEEFWDAETGLVKYESWGKATADLRAKLTDPAKKPDGGLTLPDTPVANDQDIDALLATMGHSQETIGQEWTGNNGKLKDQTYATFQGKGYPRAMVDMFFQNQQAAAQAQAGQAAAARQQAHTIAGGEQQLDQLLTWAKGHYSPAMQEQINNQLATPALAVETVQSILSAHQSAAGSGNTVQLLSGDGSAGTGLTLNYDNRREIMHRKDTAAKDAKLTAFHDGTLKNSYRNRPLRAQNV